MPRFSFVIASFNNRDILAPCFKSIADNLKAGDYEIVLSDNGSVDGSIDFIKENYPSTRIIENGTNLGFAAAINKGIKISEGKYIVLMNTDIELTPNVMYKISEYMDKNPDVGICTGGLIGPDGKPQNSVAVFPGIVTEVFNKSILKLLFPKKYPGKVDNVNSPIDVDSIIGAVMVVRKSAIEKIGALDERFFFYMEETDWCLRMKRGGYRVSILPDAKIVHHLGKTAKKYPIRSKIEYFISSISYMKKNHSHIYAFTFSVGLFFKVLISLIINLFLCLLTFCLIGAFRIRVKRYGRLAFWFVVGMPISWGLRGIKQQV
jgi:GT2 family glycosyltransferase